MLLFRPRVERTIELPSSSPECKTRQRCPSFQPWRFLSTPVQTHSRPRGSLETAAGCLVFFCLYCPRRCEGPVLMLRRNLPESHKVTIKTSAPLAKRPEIQPSPSETAPPGNVLIPLRRLSLGEITHLFFIIFRGEATFGIKLAQTMHLVRIAKCESFLKKDRPGRIPPCCCPPCADTLPLCLLPTLRPRTFHRPATFDQ